MSTADPRSVEPSRRRQAMPSPASTGGPRLARTRALLLVIFYALLSLWALSMARGALLVISGHLPTGGPELLESPFLHWEVTGWKLLSLGGVLVLSATAGRSVVAAQWLLLGEACWLVGSVIAPEAESHLENSGQSTLTAFVVSMVIWFVPWLLLSPQRRQIVQVHPRPDAALGLAWVVAVIPLVVWTHSHAQTDELDLVGLPVTFLLVGGWAALRPGGRWWPAATVGVTACWVGGAALAWPTEAGSPGQGWGVFAFALGLGVLLRAVIGSHARTSSTRLTRR